MRINCPSSPNHGKVVEVIRLTGGYDAVLDEFREDYADVRIVESGKQGGINVDYLEPDHA